MFSPRVVFMRLQADYRPSVCSHKGKRVAWGVSATPLATLASRLFYRHRRLGGFARAIHLHITRQLAAFLDDQPAVADLARYLAVGENRELLGHGQVAVELTMD